MLFFLFFFVFWVGGGGFMVLADTYTCPVLGPLVPLFWISGDVSSGFQSQSGFCLIHLFCGGKCNVHSPRSNSAAIPANLLTAGITARHFPTCISRCGSWLRFKRVIIHTEDKNTTIVAIKNFIIHLLTKFLHMIILYLDV